MIEYYPFFIQLIVMLGFIFTFSFHAIFRQVQKIRNQYLALSIMLLIALMVLVLFPCAFVLFLYFDSANIYIFIGKMLIGAALWILINKLLK